MDTFIGLGAEILRLVPLVLAFYVPALVGMVFLKERGASYKVKATLIFVFGFGGIVAVQLLLRSASTLQIAQTITVSLLQVTVALFFAALTVYKLAD